jgi:hypothetical protein
MVAAAGWPSGAIVDWRTQLRVPMHRSDSAVFQTTYAGAGLDVVATPAFVFAGPRVSLAPIDVFDLDLHAAAIQYFPGPFGLLPMEGVGSKLEAENAANSDDYTPSRGLMVGATPTFKLKLGPIVAFDTWTVRWFRIWKPNHVDTKYVLEPYQSLILAWSDRTIEHQAAVLYEIGTGEDEPLLRIGPTWRSRDAQTSGDQSAVLGGLAMFHGQRERAPTVVLQVLPYVRDLDRVGGIPNIQGAAVWTWE